MNEREAPSARIHLPNAVHFLKRHSPYISVITRRNAEASLSDSVSSLRPRRCLLMVLI